MADAFIYIYIYSVVYNSKPMLVLFKLINLFVNINTLVCEYTLVLNLMPKNWDKGVFTIALHHLFI